MEETKRENLEPGKQYYIECLTYDYNYEFPNRPKIVNTSYPKVMGTFCKFLKTDEIMNGYKLAVFKHFRDVKNDLSSGYDVQLSDLWKFYEVKKYKIQEDMETRACNLIIADIIKDEHFRIEFTPFGKMRNQHHLTHS
jgi:hypothetical protein